MASPTGAAEAAPSGASTSSTATAALPERTTAGEERKKEQDSAGGAGDSASEATASYRESVASSDDDDDYDDDDDDSSKRHRNHRSKERSRSRARSFLARSLSRRQSRTAQRASTTDLEAGSPVTRTVSEVHDGIYIRRDVAIDGIEREEKDEREGVASAGDDDDDDNDDDGHNGNGDRHEDKKATQQPNEKAQQAAAAAAGGAPEDDPNLVKWDGPDDPANPKNWSTGKKWMAVFFVSLFTLITPVSSSMVAPALSQMGAELHIGNTVVQLLTMTIFMLAYAVGPLIVGPLSELYGRVVVLQLSNVVYFFFNLGCGLAHTPAQMLVFRFLAGLGGSAPLAIGGGVLGDLFTAEERGRALSIYSLAPLLGPAIGPIAGSFIVENTTWRWIFYATTIADGLVQGVGLFFLRESYAPVLLRWKCERLIKATGNTALHTAFERDGPQAATGAAAVARRLRTAAVRPFVMLGTQPIVQLLALYMMFLYGVLYLQLASFPTLWHEVYHQRTGLAGLNYIALGVGFTLGAQLMAPMQDRIYARLKRHYHVDVGRPEFRVPIMVPGALLVPTGLLIFGWCAEHRTHWIGPDVGAAVLTMGIIIGFQCIQGYLVDTYTRYAASAIGAATVMRSLAGFGFPLFAPSLFDRLGYGRGCTVLAGIGIAVGWPAPFLLWRYGRALRENSTRFQG